MTGAQRILADGGVDAGRGVRDLSEVADVATRHGFTLSEMVQMPANNLSVVLRRAAETAALRI